jgi:glutaryl-CoA transferase
VSEGQWKSFCVAVGAPELASDIRYSDNARRIENRESLTNTLVEIFAAKALSWWLLQFKRFKIPVSRIFDYEDIQADPQITENRFIERLDTPHWGQILVEGSPWKFKKTPVGPNRPGGLKGEHNEQVLAEFGLLAHERVE